MRGNVSPDWAEAVAETETGPKRQQETEVISRWAPISHIHNVDNDNEAIS